MREASCEVPAEDSGQVDLPEEADSGSGSDEDSGRVGLPEEADSGIGLECAEDCGAPTTVLIEGFEVPTKTDNSWTGNSIPNWTGSDSTAVNNFGVYNAPVGFFPGEAPEGSNVAFIERGAISYVTHEPLKSGTTYELSALLGDSLSDPTPGYSLELRCAGATLAAFSSTPCQ